LDLLPKREVNKNDMSESGERQCPKYNPQYKADPGMARLTRYDPRLRASLQMQLEVSNAACKFPDSRHHSRLSEMVVSCIEDNARIFKVEVRAGGRVSD
jgi:hypothetical protein